MTPADFLLLLPECTGGSTALSQTRLDWASERTDADVWGAKEDQGIAWMAAHFLCLLPEGKDMREGEKPGETMYGRERARLNKIVSSGYRVAGTS